MKLFSAIIIFCCVKLIALQPGVPKNRPYSLGVGAKVSETSKFYEYVFVGNYTTIRQNCVFKKSSSIGANVLIMDGCQFGERVNVGAKTKIRPYCKFGDNSSIRDNVFIGEHVSVGEFAEIEDNAVVHSHASIRSRTKISEREVIIKAPSSADLYKYCMPRQIFVEVVDEDVRKRDLEYVNEIFRIYIELQLKELASTDSNRNFRHFQEMISLYLLKYHGKDNYDKYCRIFGKDSWETPANQRERDLDYIYLRPELQKELLFGPNDENNVLEPEVKDSIIRLLAIWYDSQRNDEERVENDSYCKMLEDIIINKTRTVKCDSDC